MPSIQGMSLGRKKKPEALQDKVQFLEEFLTEDRKFKLDKVLRRRIMRFIP